MSQSPASQGAETDDGNAAVRRYQQGWRALNRLLHEDFSFSGHERNCAFLNLDGQRFASVASVTGFDFDDDSRAIAAADWDFDGDLDLWVTARTAPRLRFLQNQHAGRNQFVSVRLSGDGRSTNRDAIGARLELHAVDDSTPTQIRTLHAGDAFLSQSSAWVHFGLGSEPKRYRLIVRWPGGNAETFENVEPNSFYRVVQHHNALQRWQPPQPSPIQIAPQVVAPATDVARVVVPFKLPLPALDVASNTAVVGDLRQQLSGPTLINVWSSDCAPCLEELSSWASQAKTLANHGLSVIALSTDRLSSGVTQADATDRATQLVARLKLPFEWYFADAAAIDNLDCFQRGITDRWRTLPVPSSFLIDADGCVAAFYLGPVSVEQLAADTELLTANAEERTAACLPFPGRSLFGPPSAMPLMVSQQLIDRAAGGQAMRYLEDYTQFATKYYGDRVPKHVGDVHYVLGVLMIEQRQRKSGFDHLLQSVAINPDDARAHISLAELLMSAGRFAEAEQHLRQVVQINPSQVSAQEQLGMCLYRQQKYAEAAEALSSAVRVHPSHVSLHYQLAAALRQTGDWAGTVGAYQALLAAEPNHLLAANNLAWILATSADDQIRNATQAIELAERICQATGNRQPLLLDTLAVACAAAGDYQRAIESTELAASLATQAKMPTQKIAEMRERIKLYEKRKPFRE